MLELGFRFDSEMEGADGNGDDRTFRVNFSSEGVSKLRENVKEKLKEYMGDYTDDTLVVRFFFFLGFCEIRGVLWK